MYNVKKRNGKIVKFELVKIAEAIKLAFEAQEKQYNQDIIDFLALKVGLAGDGAALGAAALPL